MSNPDYHKKFTKMHGNYKIILADHWLFGCKVFILDTTNDWFNYVNVMPSGSVNEESFEKDPIVKEAVGYLIEMFDSSHEAEEAEKE